MHALRIWFPRILIILLLLVLAASLYYPVATRFTGDTHPALFGYRPAIILTGSMEPSLRRGDLVVFKEEPAYREGAVVLYQDGRQLVTHRVVASGPDWLMTRGDANNTVDAPVSCDRVLGAMVLRLQNAGRLAWFVRSPAGLALSVVALLVVFRRGRP